MNRIIKFRIWDNIKKNWCPNQSIWRINCDSGALTPPAILFPQYPEGVTIQQFTGLKDKNGREIYDGDIIKFKSYDGWFDEEGYFIALPIVWRELDVQENISAGWSVGYSGVFPKNCEIIGNILENPELIK